jgi:hypothetical protein
MDIKQQDETQFFIYVIFFQARNSNPFLLCFFLFFYYGPLSLALHSLTIDAHSVLSKVLVLHMFTLVYPQVQFIIHLNLGLPFNLRPPGLLSSNFFIALSPSILTTYLNHSNLCNLITAKISGDVNLL